MSRWNGSDSDIPPAQTLVRRGLICTRLISATPRTQWSINNPHLPLILFCPFSSAIFLALTFYGPLSRSKLVEESTQHWNKSAFKFSWVPGIGFNSMLYSNLRLLSWPSTHSSRYCVYGNWHIVIVLRSKIKLNQAQVDNTKICQYHHGIEGYQQLF